MNHYCTYFDRNFLLQGLALAASLRRHDPESVLWILALDRFTEAYLAEQPEPHTRAVALSELERFDPGLLAARANRTRAEYYFTLSPCWPRYVLGQNPDLECIIYLDADMFWFGSPGGTFESMRGASILVTEHRHPPFLHHHRRYGRFNVGLLAFRNDAVGNACLDLWRERCLAWCHDQVEDGKYADQGYLDEWPERFGAHVRIAGSPGVNLAPWNWCQYRYCQTGRQLWVNDEPLVLFHFARFRPIFGDRWFQSGQLEYGVMPHTLRQAIYGAYWQALEAARDRVRRVRPDFDCSARTQRSWHSFGRALAPRILFGSDWLRVGSHFFSGRFGLGRFSGLVLAQLRRLRRAGTSAEPVNRARPAPT